MTRSISVCVRGCDPRRVAACTASRLKDSTDCCNERWRARLATAQPSAGAQALARARTRTRACPCTQATDVACIRPGDRARTHAHVYTRGHAHAHARDCGCCFVAAHPSPVWVLAWLVTTLELLGVAGRRSSRRPWAGSKVATRVCYHGFTDADRPNALAIARRWNGSVFFSFLCGMP